MPHFIRLLFFLLLLCAGLLQSRVQAQPRPIPSAESAPKISPLLSQPQSRSAFRAFRVQVSDTLAFRAWLKSNIPAAILSKDQAGLWRVSNAPGQLARLSRCPHLRFIDVPDRPAREERKLDTADWTVNAVTAVRRRFPALTGEGLVVSVKERPFDPADIDFRGRVVRVDTAESPSTHATTMATLMAGGGNSAPSAQGVAWRAGLASSNFSNLLPDEGKTLSELGVSVQNHSYGVAIENYYGVEAQAYDYQCRTYPQLLHVFSSGNEGLGTGSTSIYAGLSGWANLTGQFKMSKNTLSVGATDREGNVSPLSSRGPAHDGRIKPELVAYGEGGSSEAAAVVSGIGLLVQQAYRDQHAGALPPASLVKAALLNSADDTGRPEVDFEAGFGQADALGAVQTIQDRRYVTDAVAQNQSRTYTLNVPAGSHELKVTLAWTDPEAPAAAQTSLVHDLDLELVYSASGQRWQPWVLNAYPHPDSLVQPARRGADHLNNAEQITLPVPIAGTYEVRVRGYRVAESAQAFSLAYEWTSGFAWLSPTGDYALRAGRESVVRWQWAGPATVGRLAYRIVGSQVWQPMGEVDLSTQTFAWTAPDTLALAQLRVTTGSGQFDSDTFALALPLSVRVGYNCGGEWMLYWNALPGAQQYQLLGLGAQYLQPLLRTADTLIVLDSARSTTQHYAVAPVMAGGRTGEKSDAIEYTTQGVACYVKSFLPEQVVTDSVGFSLEIATRYRLQSISFERFENGSFRTLQSIAPVTDLLMRLTDPAPRSGRGEYRVRLEDSLGRTFYSETEAVYRMQPNELLVFPNPVTRGQLLNILALEATPVMVQFFDNLGRLVQESEEIGEVKSLATDRLVKGLYLVRVQTSDGREQKVKIIVQ